MSWHFLQAEDIIDDIIQYQTSSLSSSYKLDPSYGDFQIKEEPLHLTDQEKKERVKKDNHNQSEFEFEELNIIFVINTLGDVVKLLIFALQIGISRSLHLDQIDKSVYNWASL